MTETNQNYSIYAKLLRFSKNIIITGPAGTGKTYTSWKITEAFDGKGLSFKEIEAENRADYITFHPTYTYGDFIEKMQPAEASVLNKVPRTEDGVLKKLANRASLDILKGMIRQKVKENITNASKIWKVSLGYRKTEERMYKLCKKAGIIALGWLEKEFLEGKSYSEIYAMLQEKRGNDEPKLSSDTSSINIIVNDMKKGDFVLIYNSKNEITDIGIVDSDYFYLNDYVIPYPHRRKVKWLKKLKKPFDTTSYDTKSRYSLETFYEADGFTFSDLREIIKESTEPEPGTSDYNNYYLLIDEINRGKVTEIFGEVITLIDKDKRNNLHCTLPLSGKRFSLPENLYIIGTMCQQSADAFQFDPVMQRRFSFIELKTNYEVLKGEHLIKADGQRSAISPANVLEALNRNLSTKRGSHIIGHTYFMNLGTLENFYHLWYFNIIPLLKSYFRDEPDTIIEITGKKFFNADGDLKFLDMENGEKLSDFERAVVELYMYI